MLEKLWSSRPKNYFPKLIFAVFLIFLHLSCSTSKWHREKRYNDTLTIRAKPNQVISPPFPDKRVKWCKWILLCRRLQNKIVLEPNLAYGKNIIKIIKKILFSLQKILYIATVFSTRILSVCNFSLSRENIIFDVESRGRDEYQ